MSETWFLLIVRTGFEPVIPPWKGGVLTPWPTDQNQCIKPMRFTGVAGFEPTHEGVKVPCLTAWLYPNNTNERRSTGIEPASVSATSWCVNHFTTTAKMWNTGSRNWTHTKGFGDLCTTFIRCPFSMEGEGFEPPNPKERIYSPPRLATSLPFQIMLFH